MKHKHLLAILVIASALCVGCAIGLWWKAGGIPEWVVWGKQSQAINLDTDTTIETLVVANHRLVVKDPDEQTVYAPSEWHVVDARVADITDDGIPEIIVLAWRRGTFGQSKPFWREQNNAFSEHIFIVRYQNHALVPLWMSSDFGAHVLRMELDHNKHIALTERNGTVTTWEWIGFGLALVEEKDTRSHTTDTQAVDATLSLLAVGDNIAHDAIYEQSRKGDTQEFDFRPLYAPVSSKIQAYDLAAVQQETIFVQDGSQAASFPFFATPATMGDALVDAGFDIVCSASNHSLDNGIEGINETLAWWNTNHPRTEILGMHASQKDFETIHYIDRKGFRLACFNYTYGLNGQTLDSGHRFSVDLLSNTEKLCADLRTAEDDADISICFLHIGQEYATRPTSDQIALVNQLIDAGADCIICTHTHVVQPAEELSTPSGARAIVFWGLGNFMSYQTERMTTLGGAADISLARKEDGSTYINSWDFLPTVCHLEPGKTCVYFLEDYTDDIAAHHLLGTAERPITCEELWKEWRQRIMNTDL